MTKKLATPGIRLSRLLMAAGLICLAAWGSLTVAAWAENAGHERELDRLLAERNVAVAPVRLAAERATPSRTFAFADSQAQTEPPPRWQEPTDTNVVGRIEISRVGVRTVILEGTDNDTLRGGVGHFPETPLPHEVGNVAFAGHRDSYFRGLRRLRSDDEITVTTVHGTFQYEVQWMRVVDPEDVHVLDASSDRLLTLVTCYPFDHVGPAPQRFVVRARQKQPDEHRAVAIEDASSALDRMGRAMRMRRSGS